MDKLGHIFAEARTIIEKAKKEDPKNVIAYLNKMPNALSPQELAVWKIARAVWVAHETPAQ